MSSGIEENSNKAQLDSAASNGHSKSDYNYSSGGHQQNSGYSMSPQSVSDAYMQGYYTPYMSYPAAPAQGRPLDGSWPSADPMSYMTGGYNQWGMYSQYDYPQGYGWFPGSEYGSDWGVTSDAYYNVPGGMADGYCGPSNGEADSRDLDALKGVERSMNSMGISDNTQHVCDTGYNNRASTQKKPTSWANIASQPASHHGGKNSVIPRAPLQPSRAGSSDNNAWDAKNARQSGSNATLRGGVRGGKQTAGGPYRAGINQTTSRPSESELPADNLAVKATGSDSFLDPSQYNPKEFDLSPKNARFFIIKSYSEDDIHRSIKYGIWCSTEYGNKRLDTAFHEREGKGTVYLLFSVNGSGHFCGMAEMLTSVDYSTSASVWTQDKWKGSFKVKWIYVKDVPNSQLRHIKLENNEGKPVTNSRDTQEVLGEKGLQVLRIIHQYRHTTSIFDDFSHYEKRQEDIQQK